MLRIFKKMNLMRKFIILLILFVIIPVLLIDLLITKKVEAITEEQVSGALLQLVSASHLTLDREYVDFDDKTEKIMISEEIQQLAVSSSLEDSIDKFNSADTYLKKYSASSIQISYSFFFPDDNQAYTFAPYSDSVNKGVFYFSRPSSLTWYEDALQAKGKGIVRIIRKFGNNPGDLNTVAYLRQLNSIYDGQKVIGYLVVSGLESQFKKDVRPLVNNKDAEVLFLNGGSQVMSSNTPKYEIGQTFDTVSLDGGHTMFKHDENGDQWLYVVDKSEFSDTKLLLRVPVNSIISQHVNVQRWVNLTMIIYFMILIILSFYFIQSILKPISRLARITRSFEPGKPLSLEYNRDGGKDEIALLNRLFINMTNRLNQTIYEKYDLGLKNKETELSILHTQINPHLLYNTLESIYWRNMIEGGTHSAEMIKDLSLIMRIGLSRGKLLISVADEIIHAEAYIRLQSFRYDYAFTVNWNVEEEAKAFLIPKVVLQPLIENAVIHGVKQMEQDGEIWITIRSEDGMVIIDVEDNGYREPDLVKLAAILEGKAQNKGYGIYNVQKRIQLHFGEGFGLSYSRREHQGLRATLVIPAVKAEEESLFKEIS
jgi:two-component system, sensor histidine kinase YesM